MAESTGEELIRRPRYGRVAFGRIAPLMVLNKRDPATFIERALVAGTRVSRYNRLWRMGQCRREGASFVGRLGFERRDVAEVWDDVENDFSEQTIRAGYAAPFAIDPGQLRVAFQPRLGLIKVMSFTGALQALMNEASGPLARWRIEQEMDEDSFDQWVNTIDRVTTLRIRLERPNPNYHGRKNVERLVERTNAEMISLVLSADPGSIKGLDINDSFVREALGHAEDYGSYSAVGVERGVPQKWDSKQEAATDVREKIPADTQTGEIPSTSLRELLGDTEPDVPEGSGP